jgi:DNA-binding transcriptional MerR regulator
MPDDPYSLGDLARLADVTPRTVRYYLAQGLLPSPEAAGPATRYSDGHLARLRLIKRLQRDHLPLAEIRLRLERLGDDEVIASVSALDARSPEPSQEPGETLSFVRSLMQRSGIRPSTSYPERDGGVRLARMRLAESMSEAFAATPASVAPVVPAPAAPARAPAPPESPPAPATAMAASPAGHEATHAGPARTTWERMVISPDVELHVRRPLDRTTNKRVDQLERIARELFEDT